jgi:hypothetical protein
MSSQARLPGIVRFLYNHNPFYLISAACLVYTLKLAFRPGEVAYIDPWLLMGAISGYTLLVAATGFLVVKLGHVWEDARSIFLVLLLLFLATSVTFDELLNLDPDQGRMLIGCGFGLAVLVTEGLLIGLGIKLRSLFHVPFLLWLALLYFFPLWVSPEVTGLSAETTRWRLLLFPISAGVLTLGLLPAVRRGAAYCRDNGTPWSWPLFPWTLFLFMGLATLFRTYALTISFLPSDGMLTAFQPYFLIPFLFAVLVLLLEMGLVERQKTLIQVTLAVTPGLLWLAAPGTSVDGTASAFLGEITSRIGSPMWMTTLALIAFHTWAALRGIDFARWYLLAVLLFAVKISPVSSGLEPQTPVQMWPLLVAAAIELMRGLRRKDALTLLTASCCLSLALSALLWDSTLFLYRRTIPYHVALVSLLMIGCLFDDLQGRVLRIVGAVLLPVSAVVAVISAGDAFLLHPGWTAYVIGIVGTTGVCWITSRDPAFLISLSVMLVTACVAAIVAGVNWMIQRIGIKLLTPLFIGIGSFVVAALISISKGLKLRQSTPSESQP